MLSHKELSHRDRCISQMRKWGFGKKGTGRLSWWPRGWESACQCRGRAFHPRSGRSPRTTGQRSPYAPQPQSPRAPEPGSARREVTAVRSSCATTRELSSEDPAQPKRKLNKCITSLTYKSTRTMFPGPLSHGFHVIYIYIYIFERKGLAEDCSMERVSCLGEKHTHKIRKFSFTVAITLKKKMRVPALSAETLRQA